MELEIASSKQIRDILEALDEFENVLISALSANEYDRIIGLSLPKLRRIAKASLESREESMLTKLEVGVIKEAIR